MIERHIHHVGVEWPDPQETAATARERLGAKFPRNALRRMTHLGMLAGGALDGVSLNPDDAVVYASTFAETRALEDYLDGLPAASPLLFQTSIHPGAIQQVLIARQQSVARLWPIASRERLVEDALLTAMLETADRVAIVAGEERGMWMLDNAMAAERPFASALLLGREAAGSLGSVKFTAGASTSVEACPSLEDWTRTLLGRLPAEWQGIAGRWRLEWR